MNIQERLFALRDENYKIFQSKLVPNLNPDTVIGVRTPLLRRFANEIAGTEDANRFLLSLPHAFYEENNLHGYIIEKTASFDECIARLDAFEPFIDNWATCDCFTPKILQSDCEKLLLIAEEKLRSRRAYTARFWLRMLMTFFLDDRFELPVLQTASSVKNCLSSFSEQAPALHSDDYYVKMMIAWFFAEALAKQWEIALAFLKENRLDKWTHNKALQKAAESLKIPDEHKALLKTLKRKI